MSRVTTVVFDLGNVLVRWDPKLLYARLLPDPAVRDRFLAEICTDAWNREQDRGRSFAEAIAERVALHPDWEAEIRAWDERWWDMVGGPIEGTVAIARGPGDAPEIDGVVRVRGARGLKSGEFARVRITGADAYDLTAQRDDA